MSPWRAPTRSLGASCGSSSPPPGGAPQVLMCDQGVISTVFPDTVAAPIFSRLDVLADEGAAYWT
jgi:hypothetical protein